MSKADYIDRNKIPWHRENFKERCHNDVWTETRTITYKSDVDNIPPADVVEVRHGRWERLNWGFVYDRCSVCGYEHRYAEQFAYCPNCGAKMKKRRLIWTGRKY